MTTPLMIGEQYYKAMGRKNVEEMKQFLHKEVEFSAPLAKLKGRKALLEAIENFVLAFTSLSIHAKFGNQNEAMIVYDLECPEPIGNVRSVARLTFKGELISRVELFYDPRPFIR